MCMYVWIYVWLGGMDEDSDGTNPKNKSNDSVIDENNSIITSLDCIILSVYS